MHRAGPTQGKATERRRIVMEEMKELFALIAMVTAFLTGGYVLLEDAPDPQYVLVGCTFAVVFALFANAARRSR